MPTLQLIQQEEMLITLLGYTLYSDDVILVRYKTSIGIYGSIYQSSLEASIEATSDANTAAQRAEEAAIDGGHC